MTMIMMNVKCWYCGKGYHKDWTGKGNPLHDRCYLAMLNKLERKYRGTEKAPSPDAKSRALDAWILKQRLPDTKVKPVKHSGPTRFTPDRVDCAKAFLPDDTVRAIKLATGTQRDIGSTYGVSQPMVSAIRTGKAYKHVA